MKRLIEKTVFSGLVTAWRLATWPTRRSPVFVNATTDGVRRPPSGFVMTTGSPPSMTATTEFVVPRSMPMILLIAVPRLRVQIAPRLKDDSGPSMKSECLKVNHVNGQMDRIGVRLGSDWGQTPGCILKIASGFCPHQGVSMGSTLLRRPTTTLLILCIALGGLAERVFGQDTQAPSHAAVVDG